MKGAATIRVGQAIDLQADKRYIQHVRDHSIGDVYDALVELITNADDSYNRLYRRQKRNRDGGDILVEHQECRKGKRSWLVVRDKAEGMDTKEMQQSLLHLGAYSSQAGNRGYMGRGAKDCTALGDLTFESIKNDRYYRAKITQDLKFVLEADGALATKDQRKRLSLDHGNGTSVTFELSENVRLPRLQNLTADLPWHYALRDIMAEDPDSRVLLRKAGHSLGKAERLVYRPPYGDLVVDEVFEVEGYRGGTATLRIWRAPEPLEDADAGSRFERFGILIKGERAIHECTLLTDEFRRDPFARRYYGRIDCPYIDQLLAEYESRRATGVRHPPENPRLLIDPNRRLGLERRHPFVDRLLLIPCERLRALLANDREQAKSAHRQVANDETQSRLNRLGKFMSRFLREQLDELEELAAGDAVDERAFTRHGVLIYPTYLRVGVGKERALTVYVKRSLLAEESEPVTIQADAAEALEVLGAPVHLHAHRARRDQVLGTFRVRGVEACDTVVLTARCNGLPTAEALVQVVEHGIDERDFSAPLEFERKEYRVRQGSRKTLRLYAKYPDAVGHETEVKISSSDHTKVVARGRCLLVPLEGSNYAEATVTIEGRTLKSKATISAEVNGYEATTVVSVIERDDAAIPIQIEITDEPLGNFRARCADNEGKPHLLLLSSKHESVARYLGPPPGFRGQELPHFRVLLAEIVAESVCRKALTLEAKERPWEFRWADLKEDRLIAEDVLARMQKRLRECVAHAHAIMLSDKEVSLAKSDGLPGSA
ncbi:MAG: hypothetical protein A2Y61_02805 [Chloroflexi bacterium RBG_13_60_13]|nr:MAG: hypothetical protein A2Y61_02805 [Chloroflexi bacterium RBG_13_60_13]